MGAAIQGLVILLVLCWIATTTIKFLGFFYSRLMGVGQKVSSKEMKRLVEEKMDLITDASSKFAGDLPAFVKGGYKVYIDGVLYIPKSLIDWLEWSSYVKSFRKSKVTLRNAEAFAPSR